jgi:PAS domain S-box-containing protein
VLPDDRVFSQLTPPDDRLARAFTTYALLAGVVSMGLGAIVLAGWILDIEVLRSMHLGDASSKANAAACFMLLGAGLVSRVRVGVAVPDVIARALGGFVAVIGALTLCEDVARIDLGIDQLLAYDRLATTAPGRMSPQAAIEFLLVGTALAVLDSERRGFRPAQLLALVSAAIALVSLLGYLYGVEQLHTIPGYTSITLHTSCGFAFVVSGILCARPHAGVMTRVTHAGSVGVVARRILPIVVLVPVLLGWLRLAGQRAGYYGTEFGLAIYAFANVLCLFGLTGWTVGALARLGSERDRALQAALDGEEDLAITLQSIGDGVIATDAKARVVRMNLVAERLTGWSAKQAAGRALEEVFDIRDEDTGKRVDTPAVRALREGHVVALASRTLLRQRGGPSRPIADSCAPIRDRAHLVRGAVLVFREQTEIRRHEQAVQRSAALESENHRVREASRMKSEFLANMSHELRTPLNGVIGFADFLRDAGARLTDVQRHAYAQNISTSGRHLLRVISDVLDLSKIEAGKLELCPEPVNMSDLVREVVATLQATTMEQRVEICVTVDAALTDVLLDPMRVKQILYNYIANAIKFSNEGGTVAVRATVDGDLIRIEVEDHGIGIAETDIPRLFVEFQQLDSSATKRHQGTGLGLAITRYVVEAHGGSVGVRSTLGVGTTFHALLPLRPATAGGAT